MTRFLIRRLLGAVPLLLGVAVLSFVFMQLAPGGPDAMFARNARMTEEALQAIRRNMGLDRPVHEQLVIWLGNLARGDLGISYTQYRPVSQVIWDVVPNTLLLMGTGMLISLAAALTFGILAARRQYGFFDNVTSFISYFGLAMPVFWFGLMLQLLFAVRLGWLPSAGMQSASGGGVLDVARHLVLPAFTIAIGSIAGWSRYVRSSTIESLGQDYVRTARAKGMEERRVLIGHVLRNALIPFVTVVGIDVPLYLTGAVLTETVFSWPGMGRLFFDALTVRDYPVLMGILLLGAVLIVLGNLIADILYGVLDPRISYG
ncbi:MAG: transporter permease [Thermomicrobiales bacterium]|jgi:peptide/nickel transport system permease protein|nr:transporter permease [Thermomicrobiales bacterium]MCD6057946.1 transporter permease [Thermomicrobiales bacterium]MDF3016289.1 transporter permease [Thermomicrobiales bacterium]